MTKHNQRLFADDNLSEISYEIPTTTDIPIQLIISDNDLRTGSSLLLHIAT